MYHFSVFVPRQRLDQRKAGQNENSKPRESQNIINVVSEAATRNKLSTSTTTQITNHDDHIPGVSDYQWGVGNSVWTLQDDEEAAQVSRTFTNLDDIVFSQHKSCSTLTDQQKEIFPARDEDRDQHEVDLRLIKVSNNNNNISISGVSDYHWGVGNSIWTTMQDREPAYAAPFFRGLIWDINIPYRLTYRRMLDDYVQNCRHYNYI